MLLNPKPGTPARIWYCAAKRAIMPYHGLNCTVITCGRGNPRNHLVALGDERRVVVPCGNLMALIDGAL